MKWLYLAVAIVAEIFATSALKGSEGFTRLVPTVLTIACVLISIVGAVLFKQHLDTPALIGIGLIIAGVVVMNVFSKSVSH